MTGNEVRETFLKYFEQRGHKRVPSSPLLPANDPTLLFTNAGMNQFKDVFLGLEKREYVRACSSQKCIRAGGKHNDLDEVGRTARHQTFFEMLGNFSFGDYFKREAIQYAWDFLTGPREEGKLGLDPERMWFTVFGGDDEVPADEEAERLWIEVSGRPERVLRFGRKDNFWQMAETGPCGPNSEINYYLGEHPDDPNFNRTDLVNGPGDDTVEIWNLVFMQYNRVETEPGVYKLQPLPAPSVDTGAGLERLSAVLQGVKSTYETDLIKPIIDFTAKLAGRAYEPDSQEGFAMRVIADHARATAFSIADSILPGNEGRNYVLRKIMRRAIYHGRHTLHFEGLFFNKVTNFVADLIHEAYPELESSRDFIERMVRLEEERFGSTLIVGLNKLDELISRNHNEAFGVAVIDAVDLAKLYDTYGLPIDLIYLIMSQGKHRMRHLAEFEGAPAYYTLLDLAEDISEEDFKKGIESLLKRIQQNQPDNTRAEKDKTKPVYVALGRRSDTRSQFCGYETTRVSNARVVALIQGENEVTSLLSGEHGELILDRTPFYAESGGQVGDVGRLLGALNPTVAGAAEVIVNVEDTYSPAQGLIVHRVRVEKGSLKVGDTVDAEVDAEKRDATRRNHTATHLMHAALREVLGTHIKQAGSVVAPTYLRFDYTHYQPLTQSEIEEIEDLVNYYILRNEPVLRVSVPLWFSYA